MDVCDRLDSPTGDTEWRSHHIFGSGIVSIANLFQATYPTHLSIAASPSSPAAVDLTKKFGYNMMQTNMHYLSHLLCSHIHEVTLVHDQTIVVQIYRLIFTIQNACEDC